MRCDVGILANSITTCRFMLTQARLARDTEDLLRVSATLASRCNNSGYSTLCHAPYLLEGTAIPSPTTAFAYMQPDERG